MGLGKMLLRTMVGAPIRHSNSIVNTAVASASAAAATAVVANIMQNRQQQMYQARATAPSQGGNFSSMHVNTLLGKLALCYYMARIDGSISVDEGLELDKIAGQIMSDSSIPASEKAKVEAISRDQNISFSTVTAFLDQAEPSALVSFVSDIENVAKTTGGVTTQEQRVIDMFKDYVTRKTGHSFKAEDMNKNAVQVDLTCPNCAGQMELDQTMLKAYCPFCGSAKIIDASQIRDVMNAMNSQRREW